MSEFELYDKIAKVRKSIRNSKKESGFYNFIKSIQVLCENEDLFLSFNFYGNKVSHATLMVMDLDTGKNITTDIPLPEVTAPDTINYTYYKCILLSNMFIEDPVIEPEPLVFNQPEDPNQLKKLEFAAKQIQKEDSNEDGDVGDVKRNIRKIVEILNHQNIEITEESTLIKARQLEGSNIIESGSCKQIENFFKYNFNNPEAFKKIFD